MYNVELKNLFLNTIKNDNSYKRFLSIFNNIEGMERNFGKDICEMSVEELLTTLDLKTSTHAASTTQIISLLRKYINWCLKNGKIVGENNLEKIDFKNVNNSKIVENNYLRNEEEFERMCAVVYKEDAFYNKSTAAHGELIVRLCFAEISKQEIILIRKDQVDYENRIIQSPIYADIQYPVSQRALELCEYCTNQKTVVRPKGVRRATEEKLCDNEYLLRARISALRGKDESAPINELRVDRWVREFLKSYYETTEVYKDCTSTKLSESHMLIRIHNSENPEEFINTVIQSEIQIKKPNIKGGTLKNKIYQIKQLYKAWENVFY